MSILDTALRYQAVGLCVLPAILAEKRPALARWKEYQQRLPQDSELRTWFAGADGLCLLTGAVSGNLELLDFDCGGELFESWARLVRAEAPGLLERVVIEKSRSGGRHVVYRCQTAINGNMRLAQRRVRAPDVSPVAIAGKEYVPRRDADGHSVTITLIETRGEGGLFLCDPSPGYELTQGRLDALSVLTEQQREILLEAAWSLNELVPEPIVGPLASSAGEDRPGDDFNRRGDVRETLRRHGWTLVKGGENEYWRRPGKQVGWSASLKDGVLYVFSSNAVPFEANRAYSPFAVYAVLDHGGDFNAAARALQQEGYGSTARPDPSVDLSAFEQSRPRTIEPPTIWELVNQHPKLREPVIEGLLRLGETMNVIAAPKTGKSWLVNDLALSTVTGRKWLDIFQCHRGDVLILDNELHPETSAHRIPKVADARGILVGDYGDGLFVQNMRGQLRDVFSLRSFFEGLKPGRFKIIILDAFYRFMPRDMDENDNGTMASVYNVIDMYADRLGSCFVLIHHSTKGNQSGKAITDVGAGAGSQSRAADTHLVLRSHEDPGVVVLDAAVRSWPPVDPLCLRWQYPVWTPAPDLDPGMLRSEKPKRKPTADEQPPGWTPESFAAEFISPTPRTKDRIISAAHQAGVSRRQAERLLQEGERMGVVYRWYYASNVPVEFASAPQPRHPGGEL